MGEATGHGLSWHRGNSCADNSCVEAARQDERVYVRDSKQPDGAVLCFTLREWEVFLGAAKRGEFDLI